MFKYIDLKNEKLSRNNGLLYIFQAGRCERTCAAGDEEGFVGEWGHLGPPLYHTKFNLI